MTRRHRSNLSRRQFIHSSAAAAALATAPRFVFGAQDDKPLKIGLIGAGGRGTGAALNAMDADPNVRVVALADLFADNLGRCARKLGEVHPIDEKNCFVGWDAYKKLLETDVDYVILATPPRFRPEHLAAASTRASTCSWRSRWPSIRPACAACIESGEKAEKEARDRGWHAAPPSARVTSKRSSASRTARSARSSAAQSYWNGGAAVDRRAQARDGREVEWQIRRLVQLGLALRRSHRRAAHPQHGREQLGHRARTRSRPGHGRPAGAHAAASGRPVRLLRDRVHLS